MRVRSTSSSHTERAGARRRGASGAIGLIAVAGLLAAPAAASAVSPVPESLPADSASVAALADGPRTTKATVKKTSCASISRKVKKAKGKQRTQLRKQLKRCQSAGKTADRALKAIRDGRYVGTRGDGQSVDWTYCANGKYQLRTTGRDGTGLSAGSSWRVGSAERNGSKGFTAIVEDPKRRSSVGFVLRGGKWSVGVARSDGSVESVGSVQRTDAKAACAAL